MLYVLETEIKGTILTCIFESDMLIPLTVLTPARFICGTRSVTVLIDSELKKRHQSRRDI